MNGFNFTERTRKVLALAREDAIARDHEYIGTEHIVLGLIGDADGVAPAVLRNLGVDLGAVVRMIDETVKRGRAGEPTGPDLPYTSRSKKVLELAMAEARELNHTYVGTEHLLLGVLREGKGIGAQVLVDAGARVDTVRAETVRLLGNMNATAAPTVPPGPVVGVAVELRYSDGSTRREEFGSVGAAVGFLALPR